jgi:aspartate/methionine/tyrosine aminotransferase
MKYNFGFGDSIAVSQAATRVFGLTATRLESFHPHYPPPTGFPALNEYTLELVRTLTGRKYKHVLITHGAGGALMLLMREWQGPSESLVVTDDHYFILYPHMIARAGMIHYRETEVDKLDKYAMRLTAMPSNPRGLLEKPGTPASQTVWDACYFSPVYMNSKLDASTYVPEHRFMVGSFGKLFGVNGARLGWIATDDTKTYESLVRAQRVETVGVSTLGCAFVSNLLGVGMNGDGLYMQLFYQAARAAINNNREALRRLERFAKDPVPENGMFWFTEVDERARKLLEKAEVHFIEGTECGGTENHVRITLGQDQTLTGKMVQDVLRADRRRR